MKTLKTIVLVIGGLLVSFCLLVTLIFLVVFKDADSTGVITEDSMYPTMKTGSIFFADKEAYKNKFPQRGDIVVLKFNKQLESLRKTQEDRIVKRIIGLPSEEIVLENGQIFIDGEVLIESYLKNANSTLAGDFLLEGVEVKIPPESYFVMGDNRENSFDSRDWGFVQKDDITAKVESCLARCQLSN